jgi:hypothetical protein
MRIAESALLLQSQHEATNRREIHESLRAWDGERPQETAIESSPAGGSAPQVFISSDGYQAAAAAHGADDAQATGDAMDAADADPHLRLIKSLVEMLIGKEIEISVGHRSGPDSRQSAVSASVPKAPQGPSRNEGWGAQIQYREVREETESTNFRAQGFVRTTDGREIAFDFGLSMSRSYREEASINVRGADARQVDPLVIGPDGASARLSSGTFRFDLNGDGRTEDVPMLVGGSGYLALDLNKNGLVDNGRELFGPASGNGFTDLAAYDEDRNGWIDENDSVFRELSVWAPSLEGPGTLTSLTATGVGALSLAAIETRFELRSATNQSLGTVRASSVYLAEDGTTGALQHIDLTA